jgi:phage host-nuclease inhibitor protein Gam
MEKAVNRIKKIRTAVPTSLNQAEALIGKIGQTQDAVNEIEKDFQEKIAKLKAEAEKKLQPLVQERANDVSALFAFANPRKDDLTRNARTVKLGSGAFGWRWTTPRVETSGSDEEMIAWLKKTGNDTFVRVIEEIDRQALLAERPIVPGISYVQDDEFFVVPKQKSKKAKTFTQAVDR